MKKPSLDDAAHPSRQIAIRLIEHAIEPVLRPQRGINGEQYYELEDAIVEVLRKNAEPMIRSIKLSKYNAHIDKDETLCDGCFNERYM